MLMTVSFHWRHVTSAFFALMAGIIVAGCSLLSNPSTLTLWSDVPELVSYAELFNSDSQDTRVEVRYRMRPWESLLTEEDLPDLVVASRLNGPGVIELFAPLDDFLDGENGIDAIYPAFLDMGQYQERQLLLPLSFSLPAIVFQKEFDSSLPDSYSIDFREMRKIAREYNVIKDAPDRIGYSPRWQPEMMYTILRLFDVDFQFSQQQVLVWNNANLGSSVDFFRDWIREDNGGLPIERSFETKYLHDPFYKLLQEGRILFTFYEINDYIHVPSEIRETMRFRWLSDGNKTPVNEDIVFLGRPRQSKRRRGANRFIRWLFRSDTQIRLMEESLFRRERSFGIAGGFSSLQEINSSVIPRMYPFLLGYIPSVDIMELPKSLPETWEQIRQEVIFPWLLSETEGEISDATLEARLRVWQQQQPAYR